MMNFLNDLKILEMAFDNVGVLWSILNFDLLKIH